MTETPDWKKQVFGQKGLWEVYWLTRKTIPSTRANRAWFWGTSTFFFGLALWGSLYGPQYYGLHETATFVIAVANLEFPVALAILGFLITGFAIFASVTNRKLFSTLAQIPYKPDGVPTGISRLQFVFFNFLNAFSVYISLLAITAVLLLAFSPASPLDRLNSAFSSAFPRIAMTTNFFAMGFLIVWFVSAFLRLKSFVWNLYQAVLLSIVTEDEIEHAGPQARER